MTKKYNILVVDDMKMMKMVVSNYIKKTAKETVKIFEASNGKEALDIVHKEKIDLIFTDITMPVMNGIEFAEQMKKENLEIPFVIVSAQKNQQDIMKGMALGAVDYITKPYKKDKIAKVMDKYIV